MPPFQDRHRVVYAECTLGDHVFYSRYWDIIEAARGAFFREVGHPLKRLQGEGCLFPVVRCQAHYRAPARYDDVLMVELSITAMTAVKLEFQYRLVREDQQLLLSATTSHACTSLQETIQPIPDILRSALRPYMVEASRPPSTSRAARAPDA
jgi:acyl-CoA thioester hydrolase